MPAASPQNYGSGQLDATLDLRELAALDIATKAFDPALRKAMRRRIRGAGKTAADKVKGAAEGVGSVSIPPAVVVTNSFTAKRQAITVKVAQSKLPEGHKAVARMVEGQRSGRGYRHPVYGHDVWVTQQPKPYFYKTLDDHALRAYVVGEVTGAMTDAEQVLINRESIR